MLSKLFIALCLMALCVTIHAIGLTAAFSWMKGRSATIQGRFWPATWMLICIAGWAVLMHLLQIAVWAFFYAWKHGMPDLTSAFYFSAVTYTTTGYGDLVLPKKRHRSAHGHPHVRLVHGNVLRRLHRSL